MLERLDIRARDINQAESEKGIAAWGVSDFEYAGKMLTQAMAQNMSFYELDTSKHGISLYYAQTFITIFKTCHEWKLHHGVCHVL